jgi:uncharacterized protein
MMEQRLIEFIAGLRAAGARISVAESMDSFNAIHQVGVADRETFRAALRATLIKESADIPTFDRLFPQYFAAGAPPMQAATGNLTEEQRQELMERLEDLPRELAELLQRLLNGESVTPKSLKGRPQSQRTQGETSQSQSSQNQGEQAWQDMLDRLTAAMLDRLSRLLNSLMTGEAPDEAQLEQLGQEVGLQRARHPLQQDALTQRMLRAMGMEQLKELLNEIMRQLAEAGLSAEAGEELRQTLESNAQAVGTQVRNYVGENIGRQVAEQEPHPVSMQDLMERPFQSLSEAEADQLRTQVRRLAAQLRNRAALRYRRGRDGLLDPKATLRANLRFGGIPVEIKHRHRQLKPKLLLICDISTSMRAVVEFLLTLIYELQDQVARARSFAFIDDISEITEEFSQARPQVAIERVLKRMPAGYYNTDLGFSLSHFANDHLDAIDQRTTVIFVGDGRNNYNPPRLEVFELVCRRAKRVVWFNPEPPALWGTGDSDMPKYLELCQSVHQVGTLAQLADAVDHLLV